MIDKRRIGELTGITDRATHHSRKTGLWTQCRFGGLQSGTLCACPSLSVFGCLPRPGIGFVEQFTFTLEAQGLIAGITSERSMLFEGMGLGAPCPDLQDLPGKKEIPGQQQPSGCPEVPQVGCRDAHVDVGDSQSEGGCWLFWPSPRRAWKRLVSDA